MALLFGELARPDKLTHNKNSRIWRTIQTMNFIQSTLSLGNFYRSA
jgi:hypothetical protein